MTPSADPSLGPRLTKRALSLFFRVGCPRQLLLYLYGDAARAQLGMPPRQGGRAGLGLVGRHGYQHQAAKVRELQAAFGAENIIVGHAVNTNGQTASVDLGTALRAGPTSYQIVVEAQFGGNTAPFRAAMGLDAVRDAFGRSIDVGDLQPDLIQVLPPLGQHLLDNPDLPPPNWEEVRPDGTTHRIDPLLDRRTRLRVADIKLSSEPGAHYFAETVFYSMALAGWLEANDLHQAYSVVAAPAVVPGSFEASRLVTQLRDWNMVGHVPSPSEATIALEYDLEIAPVEAFAPRIRDLITQTLPRLLERPWEEAPIHVDYRCRGCEFLGDPHIQDRHGTPTQHPLHCWVEAEQTGHLSRVFGLSRGAADVLRSQDIREVGQLAAINAGAQANTPTPPAFQHHHGLRARRTVFPSRADSLQQRVSSVIANSGGDALMPRWPDLHVYLFLEFDPATSLTVAAGCRAFWKEPLPFNSALQAQQHRWGRAQGDTEVFLVDRPSIADERREFIRFLRHLREIFRWVMGQDTQDDAAGRRDTKTRRSSYQIYLWDEAQRRHFVRLVSRHLASILADPSLRQLAWLFPPPELLANPDTESRRTPYTIVYDVVQNTIAVPAPHHYTLLDVARTFNVLQVTPPSIHPLYRETLSNLAPPERIHEYWNRVGNWQQTQDLLLETAEKKLFALGIVVASLERQLAPVLSRLSAPPLPTPPARIPGLAPESNLWLEFTRLNGVLESLEIDRVRAMPPHEREARFRSAHLVRRVRGNARLNAWRDLARNDPGLPALSGDILIYELAEDSREFNARVGDFNYALAPADQHGFLDRHPYALLRNTPVQAWGDTIDDANLTSVSIIALDRLAGVIALKADRRSKLRQLARHARQIDLSHNVILDPVHRDFLTSKVALTLQGIGNPICAQPTPRLLEALGLPANFPAGTEPIGAAAEVLWQADQLHARASGRDVGLLRTALQQHLLHQGRVLMPDQWAAWEQALGRQFALIWGPPGTGKSHTLRAIVLGAVLDAALAQRSLRLLVTASTYAAVDNVLLQLHNDLGELAHTLGTDALQYRLVRVQSDKRPVDQDFSAAYPDIENLELNKAAPSAECRALARQLDRGQGLMILGAPAQQLHNLAVAGTGRPRPQQTQRSWFDLVIIDEASQLDVATSALVFSKRATGGACVLAGDDLQLPPIHQAEPPEGLENHVGSIYNYVHRQLGVPLSALNVSFRSGESLISFTRQAGYDPSLRAHSPRLQLNIDAVPLSAPSDWPTNLPWSSDYARILDPSHPSVCLIYEDRQSAQANVFEARHVAALTTLLRTRLRRGLLNELDALGNAVEDGRLTAPEQFSDDEFWEHGVGIVVPHRAQMGLVIAQLRDVFPVDAVAKIRSAVDTVERFQGQERDVVIASFGLGDPDLIAAEDEFLYSLTRFNVMASRARAKLIVFVTRSLIEHLPDDSEVLRQSLLLKRFAEQFCQAAPGQDDANPWELRWR